MANTRTTEDGAAGTSESARNETDARQGGETRPAEGTSLQGSKQSAAQGREVQVGGGQDVAATQGRQGLARYSRDPFSMMQRLSEEMDDLFESFFYGRPVSHGGRHSHMPSLWAPEVEMSEEGNRLRVCVDLPGIPKDNVKVDIHEGVLTIQGERREERTEGGEQQGFRRSERRYGSFYRSIPLPEGAETEKAEAQMKDGVLQITLPMTPPKQAKRLEIKD
jgi:HSP20 family protein